jgi:ribosomal protein L39E
MAIYKSNQKKTKLAKHGRRTKWAPFWTVLRKYGPGKKVHPSRLTRVKRNWRTRKLKLKPRRMRKDYLG